MFSHDNDKYIYKNIDLFLLYSAVVEESIVINFKHTKTQKAPSSGHKMNYS